MTVFFNRFVREEEGQDLIEYTLVLAFIALAAVAIFSSMGNDISTIWTSISEQMSAAASN